MEIIVCLASKERGAVWRTNDSVLGFVVVVFLAFVLLDIVLATVTVLLAVLGGVVSALTLEKPVVRNSMIATFIVLGLGSLALIIVQETRAQNDQREARGREDRLQVTLDNTRLDSAKSISFLSGRIDALTSLFSNPPPSKDLKRVVEAILQAGTTTRVQATDVQLREAAFDLARRLRDFQQRIDGEDERAMSEQLNNANSASTPEQRRQTFVEASQRTLRQLNQRQIEFGPLRAEAQSLESQLLNRLPLQPTNRTIREILDGGGESGVR